MADRIAWNPWGELDCRMVLFTSDLDPTILRMRLSINSPAGMGRRAATFQSSRLRYCITARWAMLGNSADCLPVIPVCFLGGRSPRGSSGRDSHRALANQQKPLSGASRPLLPDAIALLNMGRQSPRADIASAGWKCL